MQIDKRIQQDEIKNDYGHVVFVKVYRDLRHRIDEPTVFQCGRSVGELEFFRGVKDP